MVTELRLPICGDISPLILLLLSETSKTLDKLNMEVGIFPDSLLSERSMNVKFLSRPTKLGIEP